MRWQRARGLGARRSRRRVIPDFQPPRRAAARRCAVRSELTGRACSTHTSVESVPVGCLLGDSYRLTLPIAFSMGGDLDWPPTADPKVKPVLIATPSASRTTYRRLASQPVGGFVYGIGR